MGNAIDRLFNEWNQLGGSVLLDSYESIAVEREQEQVIAESTSYCRRSGRLTWIMLDWLIRNVDDIGEMVFNRGILLSIYCSVGVLFMRLTPNFSWGHKKITSLFFEIGFSRFNGFQKEIWFTNELGRN